MRNKMLRIKGWLILIMGFWKPVSSKYAEGHLITTENWAFLARFCFLSEEGQFEYQVEYDQDYGPINVLLYYDAEDQWPAVYKSNKTCPQKENVLNISNKQIVNLTLRNLDSGCMLNPIKRAVVKGPNTVICHHARRFRSARERWWFIAVSNCNASKGLNVMYRFLMTNGPPGDYWHEHLSADEFYILPVLMTFTIIYMIMILAIVMCSVELKARQFLHATYKLFIVSVSLQELGIMSQGISYIRYAVDGLGYNRLKNFGRMCESASEICFLLLLLLLAKGYTVTRGRLRLGSSVKLTIFMCLYVVCYTCLFIYEREFFDPGEVLYLYESPAGYGLITLRIIAWWMFIYSTVFTLKHYPEKANFYYPFNIIGTLWFIAGPGFILTANSVIDKWVREGVVCAVLHVITFGGHFLFLILTLPSKANKNFPYHVRTNQIGMMEMTGVAGNNSLYQFGHHPYAPGGPLGVREVPIELFSVTRHMELRTKHSTFEMQPYPHQYPPGFTPTILMPISLKNSSNHSSPYSSGYNTPHIEEENNELNSERRVSSALVENSEKMVRETRKTVSAMNRDEYLANGNSTIDIYTLPTAPDEQIFQSALATNISTSSRPTTASTVSLNTNVKNKEKDYSVEKLTNMFAAQSQK